MVTSLKDEDGRIVAYAEWRLVGPSGYEMENGEYVWISDLWIHSDFERTKRINRLIDEVMMLVPMSAKYCYFTRHKYGGRKKMFSKEFWERRRNRYDSLITKEI